MRQDVSVTTLPPEQGNQNRTMFGCRWIARRVSSCWTPDSVVVLKIPYGRWRCQGERWQVESKIRNFGVNDTFIRNFYDTNFSQKKIALWWLKLNPYLDQELATAFSPAFHVRLVFKGKGMVFRQLQEILPNAGCVGYGSSNMESKHRWKKSQIAAGSQSINLLHPVDTPLLSGSSMH